MTVVCHVLPSPSQGAATMKVGGSGRPPLHPDIPVGMRPKRMLIRGRLRRIQSAFDSMMNIWPPEWCYDDENPEKPTEEQMRRLASSTSPQTFVFENVVTPPQIIQGVFAGRTSVTLMQLKNLGRDTGGNNAGLHVVEQTDGVRLLLKTIRNAPGPRQDLAKSTTREAYMQIVAAHAIANRVEAHGPPPGIVPAVHFAGLENDWNPTSFLVMDYIDPEIEQLHKNTEGMYTMNDREFFTVAQSLMRVVSSMLRAGVSHNDIDPRNIIILKNHQVAVVDFGESCLLFFDRTQERDFRERFSCHPFFRETRTPKYWVGFALHHAGYRDVRETFFALYKLLTRFTEGISDTYMEQTAHILETEITTEDSGSIYSGISGERGRAGGYCSGLAIPNPGHLDKLHKLARAKTEEARFLLTRVEERMRSVLEGAGSSASALHRVAEVGVRGVRALRERSAAGPSASHRVAGVGVRGVRTLRELSAAGLRPSLDPQPF